MRGIGSYRARGAFEDAQAALVQNRVHLIHELPLNVVRRKREGKSSFFFVFVCLRLSLPTLAHTAEASIFNIFLLHFCLNQMPWPRFVSLPKKGAKLTSISLVQPGGARHLGSALTHNTRTHRHIQMRAAGAALGARTQACRADADASLLPPVPHTRVRVRARVRARVRVRVRVRVRAPREKAPKRLPADGRRAPLPRHATHIGRGLWH